MKKLIGVLILVFLSIGLSSCNKTIFDTNYEFDHAYTKISDEWKDYDDQDQIQIKLKDGTVLLLHSSNCTLVNEK